MKPHRLLRFLGTTTALVLLLTGVVQAGALPPFGSLAWPLFSGVTPARRTMIPMRLANPSAPTLAPSWHVEPVDSGGDVGLYPSLALDAAGRPHISYLDWTNKALKYAYYDGSNWLLETVPGAGYIGGGATSLVLDDQGWPHIAYCTGEEGYNYCLELRYAWRDVTTWYTDTVDGGGTIGDGSGASLALDVAGQPHIAYNGCGGLCYASYDGTAWVTTTVGYGGAASLVLDAAGRPHIAYGASWLRYAYYDGANWVFEDVAELAETYHGSLALDATGRPHIAYCVGYHPATSVLWYAARGDEGWHSEWIAGGDLFVGGPGGSSLALDAAGTPHVSYSELGKLRYAHHDGAAWWIERIGTANSGSTSLVLDAAGRAHLSYYTGDLKYAYRLCTPVLGAEVRGPARLPIGATGRYTATAGPLDANLPVTLTWADGTLSATVAYSWTVASPVSLTVTATNSCGEAHGALTVTVCLPLDGVTITGPMVLYAGQEGTYTATPLPISATSPFTYTWDNSTVGPTATYSWATSGTQALAVTAHNDCGSMGATTLQIQVIAWPYSSYLPLLWRE